MQRGRDLDMIAIADEKLAPRAGAWSTSDHAPDRWPGSKRPRPRDWLRAALLALVSAVGPSALAGEASSDPLRLCADPANLPFSSNQPDNPGLYLEIGQVLGRAIGRQVTEVWNLTYFGKRALRTTLLAGQCDAAVGLPDDQDFMGPRIIFTKPVLRVGYAVASPKAFVPSSLDDLAGRRVAVQFGSPPQSLLAERDDIQAVTFREPEEAVRALADGRVDAAFVWGPTAGYLNATVLHHALTVVPVEGPGMQWTAAVGLARGQTALRDELNLAIDRSGPAIEALRVKYGVSTGAAIALTAGDAPSTIPAPASAGRSDAAAAPRAEQTPPQHLAQAAERPPAPASGSEADLAEGLEIFNGICAHCHGPNAVQAERRIDLRLLRHRYADKMDELYRQTVTHGRPSKGMPNWSEVLTAEQIEKVLVFLHSAQTD
jgi:ABC-type amino acid transport substrate-binding protein/mono/diheme cytochrome c family protein